MLSLEKILTSLQENKEISRLRLEQYRVFVTQIFDQKIQQASTRWDEAKKIITERTVLLTFKIPFRKMVFPIQWRLLISAPFIYAMIIPALVLHLFLEIYHQVCFRLYKIPLVSSASYFIWDRHKLPYLNAFEKFNCAYCSYFNGLIAYTSEIAGRTERYFCPIKHAQRRQGEHSQYHLFSDYSAGESYHQYKKDLERFDDFTADRNTP